MKWFACLLVGATCIAFAHPAAAQMRPMSYAEVTVETTPTDAFSDWTTGKTVEAFFAPQATIDPVPGGLYELCFDVSAAEGECGNDNGRVLALEDGKMVSFTWAMPPYMAEIRPHRTVVQIRFTPVGDTQTRVQLFHTGYGDSDAWDKGRTYFDGVWPKVLQNYRDYKMLPPESE